MTNDIDCPPYRPPVELDDSATILALASRASDAVNHYRDAMDAKASFRETMRAAGHLARATERLTTAIADAVACGDNTLS